jgi:probable HAF family extracellular repeat protein
MKNRNRSIFALALLLVLVASSTISWAAEPRYRVIDLGSPGSPQFYTDFSGLQSWLLNNDGTVVGGMGTVYPDPFGWQDDGFTSHAFEWKNGSLTDLGATAFNNPTNFSQGFWINDLGHSVGIATYNASNVASVPLFKAVLWKDRQMIDLGTLGGEQSFAQAINIRDQTVGWALNLVPASVNIWADYPWPFATQQRAVLWESGVGRDLGTLGGPSAWATGINDNGQIIGQSLNTISAGQPKQVEGWSWSRPVTGFLWENGHMVDLGNLGGTFALPTRINNRGQVIGLMTSAGDTSSHPFLWENGSLKDLGTLGGSSGRANAINESGEVVGGARLANGLNRAFLWKDGVMTNLGTLGTGSQAWGINSKSQIVGTSGTTHPNLRAFLWENGGPMLDLNQLIPAGSPVVAVAYAINNRGEILCNGPNEQGLFLLLPTLPVLNMAWVGNNVVLSWPTNHTGYTLEAKTDMSPLSNWTSIPGTPTILADQFTVTNSAASGNQFFRLRR